MQLEVTAEVVRIVHADGRAEEMREHWSNIDRLGIMQQLGAIPG